MNIYIYHISLTNYILSETKKVNGRTWVHLDYVEIGPFNLPDTYKVKVIKDTISDIPSDNVISNWWIDFSTWEDFHGIRRSGTKLPLHLVVSKMEKNLEMLINSSSNIEWIDENGNITINLNETSATLHQEFRITARRKKLRRLENIAAYNVARHISGETDAEELPLPKTMKKLICKFVDTFSVDL
jgi:hypothetical protein